MGRLRRSRLFNSRQPATRQQLLLRAVVLLAVVGVPLVVFAQIRTHEFLKWDDYVHIVDNGALRPFTAGGIWRFWKEPYFNLYVPVTYTFFALEAWVASHSSMNTSVGGLDPAVFHLGSLGLHLGNVLLVFFILRRLVRHEGAACCGALLFAVHPLQVEPVAWASGTRDLLATFFSLLAVQGYLRFAEPALPSTQAAGSGKSSGKMLRSRRARAYLLASVALVLGLLSKPSTVAVPLVVLVIDATLLRRPVRTVALSLAPWIVLSLAVTLLTKWQQPDEILHYVPSPAARPRIAGDALAFYCFKLCAPFHLAPDYARSPRVVLKEPLSWLWASVPLVLLGALCFLNQRRVWLASAGIFVAAIAPVLGLLPFGYQDISTVADRYVYLAMLGPALALAWFLARHWTRGTIAATAICVTLLGIASYRQAAYWRDQETLFTYCLRVSPQSSVAHNAVGLIHHARREYPAALNHFRTALELDPLYATSYANLGTTLQDSGHPDEAVPQYEKAIALWPSNPAPYNNLGNIYLERGQLDRAIANFQKALSLSPGLLPARLSLGVALVQRGQWNEAWPHIWAVLQRTPQSARAHSCAAYILLNQGRIVEAKAHLTESLRLNPHQPALRNILEKLAAE